MRFASENDKAKWMYSCEIKCSVDRGDDSTQITIDNENHECTIKWFPLRNQGLSLNDCAEALKLYGDGNVANEADPCDYFMYSKDVSAWGCTCCQDHIPGTGGRQHDNWDIYKMSAPLNWSCSGDYVDCSGHGGYAPQDECLQTCVQDPNEEETPTARDTVRSELSIHTTEIILNGSKIDVFCELEPLQFLQTTPQECCLCYHDPSGIKLNLDGMKDTVDQKDDVYKPALAPNGSEWQYDCSVLEKILFVNCWDDQAVILKSISYLTGFALIVLFI